MDKNFLAFVIEDAKREVMRQSGINEKEAEKAAEKFVSKVDWNNKALMEKSLSWMVKRYLEKE